MFSVNKMIQHHNKRLAFPAFVLGLIVASHAAAQEAKAPKPFFDTYNNCESNISWLDYVHSEAGESGLVIAIARLGDGEQPRRLNQRRLHNVRLYLEKVRGRAPKTLIVAEGEQVQGRGRVEFYVGGKLMGTLSVGRAQDLYAGSCDGTGELDHLFYDSRRRKSP